MSARYFILDKRPGYHNKPRPFIEISELEYTEMTTEAFKCTCGFYSSFEATFDKHIEMFGAGHTRRFETERFRATVAQPMGKADPIELQRNEFNSLAELSKAFHRLPAVVDDDYPDMRHEYEIALRSFLRATKANGKGNEAPPIGPGFLEQLREANLARAPRFGHGDPSEFLSLDEPQCWMVWGPMQWGCALAGEVGELCNKLKKFERQLDNDPRRDELVADIGAEIADCLTYLDLVAAVFSISLARVTALKFNDVSKRNSMPERMPL